MHAAVLAGALGAALLFSCTRPTEPPNANTPPTTSMANIPKQGDTVFALATLYWNGGDFDGFVAGYQYRYFTYHLAAGSSVLWTPFDSTAWTYTTETSLTIAFNSSDSLNKQEFHVRAVDNNGAYDPVGAEKTIYTTRAAPPKTKIVSPVKGTRLLVIDHTTDWWPGVKLLFTATDQTENGRVVDYAWSVDGGAWTWGKDTLIYVTPDKFAAPIEGTHYFKVISRNNTNLIDPTGDSVAIDLIKPTFAKKILIIDETDEANSPFITVGIQDSTVDNFYSRVFPGADSWDYKEHNGMPPRDTLAQYRLVVWHADDVPVSKPHKISLPANVEVIEDYLNVGGKFIMSGWRILKSFAYYQNFPFTFGPGNFVYDYLHIQVVDETDIIGDCTGGKGKTGVFSDVHVDSAKLAFFPYMGKLAQVNIIPSRAGFTDVLYSYVNADDSPNVTYRGRAIALRYYGTSFDAAVLGFPLYFIREDDAKRAGQELLRSLGIN